MARKRMPNSSLPYASAPIGAKKSPAAVSYLDRCIEAGEIVR